ncbi:hypothetical protein [Lentzea indica]|nr:hypothetical protein [Lentzea indica]
MTHGLTRRALNKTRSVVDDTLLHEVTKIEFWADNPDAMVRVLRK